MKKYMILFIMLLLTGVLTACGSFYKYVEGKVNIVATTTMLGDLSKQIGGDKVSITTLMGVGVDPHGYAPKASDTNALTRSDFIVYGGLHLEGKMVDVLDQLSEEKMSLDSGKVLIDSGANLLLDSEDNIDPHIWFNVQNWIIIAESFIEKLTVFDADNKDYYETRGSAYIQELQNLHEWIISEVSVLPVKKRILVTAHDAFQYFSDAYGFEVEAIQGISTQSEASITNINTLVDLVIEKKVKAIFVESSVPQKTIDSVRAAAKSKGYTLELGGELYSDSLGDGIDSEYIQAVKTNVEKIVKALK